MAIEVNTEEAKLLAEIGFLGIGRGLPGPAEVVFASLLRVRPQDEVAPIGRALAFMALGAPARAVEVLRAALQTEAVIAFRAMAHSQLGETALAQELRDELISAQSDPALIEIAKGALSEN